MNKTRKIIIIDCGIGNICNIEKAVRLHCRKTVVSCDPKEVKSAAAIVLPGVGSFKSGMAGLERCGLVGTIKDFAATGKPILGICLGAQLLMTRSYEMGVHDGLGLISGEVRPFPPLDNSHKIPDIGWRTVRAEPKIKSETVSSSFKGEPAMYFVHSYVILPSDEGNILAKSSYGGYEFCAVVGKGNILGTQFHPERSGEKGLKFLERIIHE